MSSSRLFVENDTLIRLRVGEDKEIFSDADLISSLSIVLHTVSGIIFMLFSLFNLTQ